MLSSLPDFHVSALSRSDSHSGAGVAILALRLSRAVVLIKHLDAADRAELTPGDHSSGFHTKKKGNRTGGDVFDSHSLGHRATVREGNVNMDSAADASDVRLSNPGTGTQISKAVTAVRHGCRNMCAHDQIHSDNLPL